MFLLCLVCILVSKGNPFALVFPKISVLILSLTPFQNVESRACLCKAGQLGIVSQNPCFTSSTTTTKSTGSTSPCAIKMWHQTCHELCTSCLCSFKNSACVSEIAEGVWCMSHKASCIFSPPSFNQHE